MSTDSLRRICGLVSLLILGGCGRDEPAPIRDTMPSFAAAADNLRAKIDAGATTGAMPDAADPAVRAFDSEAARALAEIGTPALPVTGLDSYDRLCRATAGIVGSYMSAGIDWVPEDQRLELMNANISRYLDQLFTPLLFTAHCTASHAPLLEEKAGEEVTGGEVGPLHLVREDAYTQTSTLLSFAGVGTPLDPARRRRILDLLAADAARLAVPLRPEQRQELAGRAAVLRGDVDAAMGRQIDSIETGLTGAPCNLLCRM